MPVDFKQWLRESTKKARNNPKRGLAHALYYAYVGAFLSISQRRPLGTNIYEKEWDLLIILDACRADAIQSISHEYDFISDKESEKTIWSVGSTSFEWMPLTFRKEYEKEINNTSYVTGNPYPDKVFRKKEHPPVRLGIPFGPREYNTADPEDFLYLDEVSKYGVDHKVNAIRPRTMTDRAIAAGRKYNADRQIIHYMQPHEPHIYDGADTEVSWEKLQNGEIKFDELWNEYINNLKYVLDEVDLLLNNIDAKKAVITADHGESFGEWSFYGHTIACPHPSVRRVPWIQTTATDEETFEPSIEPVKDHKFNPEEHLRDLGYL